MVALIKPGPNRGLTHPFQLDEGKKAYIVMKVLKTLCAAKVKSYSIKKVLNDIYLDLGRNLPGDEFM